MQFRGRFFGREWKAEGEWGLPFLWHGSCWVRSGNSDNDNNSLQGSSWGGVTMKLGVP